jgi:hypothetical protein
MTAKSGQRWSLDSADKIDFFNQHVVNLFQAGKSATVQFIKPGRSVDQNSMIYALYRQISEQNESEAMIDIKRHCKLHFGIGILKSHDPDFSEFYDKCIKGMSYPDKLLLMTYFEVTSRFDKEMATEYIDTVIREYTKEGYSLINPAEMNSYVR